jgi:uncharacterized protein YecE (DUF72 family)
MGTYIGTAGWNIPRAQKDRFAPSGPQLERYATRLNATEINSSFHRPHAFATYERWAAVVPGSFRFAVKIPKTISHERLLTRARDPLTRFLGETAGLGKKRGPLLLQLPPSFAFNARRAGRFFDLLRSLHEGFVVCEPRHETWGTSPASRLMERSQIARVAADPPRADSLNGPGGWPGLLYFRLHGSPRPYYSSYSTERLEALGSMLANHPRSLDAWAIFDNTASGAAASNALDLLNLHHGHRKRHPRHRG